MAANVASPMWNKDGRTNHGTSMARGPNSMIGRQENAAMQAKDPVKRILEMRG